MNKKYAAQLQAAYFSFNTRISILKQKKQQYG